MAKGKNAAALFEVIHSDKRFGRSSPASEALRTPRWWFKGQQKRTASAQAPTTPSVDSPASAPQDDKSAAPVAAPGTVGIQVDSDRQQIAVRFSYTFAGIAGFALLVVIVLAYLVGTRLSSGPSVATAAPSIEQLRQEPAQPSVLEVQGTPGASDSASLQEAAPSAPAAAQATAAAQPSTLVAQGDERQNNLNYVVVQSYPDKADAEEARDLLIRNGIGATIERGLRGLHPDWYIVVGTSGFTSISAPDYKNYIQRLTRISDQSYSQKRSFKAFQPMGYKWDRAGR